MHNTLISTVLAATLLLFCALPAGAQTGTVSFGQSAYTVSENATNVSITLVFTGSTNGPATVDFTTSDGTAKAGVNYLATTGTLVFATNVTVNTFQVGILNDGVLTSNLTVNLILTNATGYATLGATSSVVLTILDRSPAQIQFSAPSYRVLTHAGHALVNVLRLGDSSADSTVNYATSDGTARNGVDYLGTSGTLRFAAGESTKSFSFTVFPKSEFQSNKTVNVALNTPTQQVAVVTIVNDHPQVVTFTNDTGDLVTITLRYAGTMSLDPAESPLNIVLEETDETSVFSVKVKKAKGSTGLIEVDSITGTGGCRLVDARNVDLVGQGIILDGYLGSVRVHDILDGAGIQAGGDFDQDTTIIAHDMTAGASINLFSRLKSLDAARVADGSTIDAPSIGRIAIKGDKRAGIPGSLEGIITLTGETASTNQLALGSLVVADVITNTSIDVEDGNAGTIKARQIVDSIITVGFTPTDANNPFAGGDFLPDLLLKSVSVSAASNGFVNSYLIALNIGRVNLKSVRAANAGEPFGVLAGESIGGVTVKTPAPGFKWNSTGAGDQSLGDFHVVK